MGLLIRLSVFLVGAFTGLYVVVATLSLLIGLGRFLIEAPRAIRRDLARWGHTHAESPRMIRYVRNEAEHDLRVLPPPVLPPQRDPPE
jgi:hypothetical protein